MNLLQVAICFFTERNRVRLDTVLFLIISRLSVIIFCKKEGTGIPVPSIAVICNCVYVVVVVPAAGVSSDCSGFGAASGWSLTYSSSEISPVDEFGCHQYPL